MTFTEFKDKVQAEFYEQFDNTLIHSDNANAIDNLLQRAVDKALSKFEKVDVLYTHESQDLPQAQSLLKWTVSTEDDVRRYPSVWDLMGNPKVQPYKVKCYLDPTRRLVVQPHGTPLYIEYLKDPAFCTIEDLDRTYLEWAISYAEALLRIKEGSLGSAAKLEGLQIETNYSELRSEGVTDKQTLEENLEGMYMGVMAIRHN